MKKAPKLSIQSLMLASTIYTLPRLADCFLVVRLLFCASAVMGVCPLLFFFLARLLSGWLSFVIVTFSFFVLVFPEYAIMNTLAGF